jgi:hypothetical protein
MEDYMEITLPAYLEVREDDGSTTFYSLAAVLRSPEKQERCIDKQELRRVCRMIAADPNVAKKVQDIRGTSEAQ